MKRFLAIAAATAAVAASPAYASAAWEFTSASNSYTNGSWNFANSFTVLNAVTVSGLGWYADPNTGNVDANPVALYKCDTAGCLTTGTLLAQVTVDNTYALQGHFRFVTVPELTLAPGDYLISGVSDTNNYTWNDTGFTVDPNIQYNDNRWFSTTSGAMPSFNTSVVNDVTDGYWGPNLFLGAATFAGVPEPATWAMMILGFGLVGASLRRREKAVARFA
ncbi:PEPxxWA-CTERM sorting domain-containing protein [Sphingomonas sp. CL5.1]|uniref:PEPxxWA-CTERM sorting domain-containing protein n=1 Tax=Sphingomonas sp. CL5.1 TaxID=2653203 RepID=UPI0020C65430|nr:PEPxxWA-CTERM sorting domain-containing protein [Sphingomonas sp. CL5.1]